MLRQTTWWSSGRALKCGGTFESICEVPWETRSVRGCGCDSRAHRSAAARAFGQTTGEAGRLPASGPLGKSSAIWRNVKWSWAAAPAGLLLRRIPTLVPFDQGKWAKGREREREPVTETLELFRLLRRSQIRLLRGIPKEDLERTGFHPERGTVSLQTPAGDCRGPRSESHRADQGHFRPA